jgi:hypothetical protein
MARGALSVRCLGMFFFVMMMLWPACSFFFSLFIGLTIKKGKMSRVHRCYQAAKQEAHSRASGRVQRCREKERKKNSFFIFLHSAEINIMSKLFNPRIALFMGAYIPENTEKNMAIVSEVLHGDM